MSNLKSLACAFALLACIGCRTSPPNSFVQGTEPGWAVLEVRDELEFDEAWAEVTDVLAKQFELEMISKEGGYLRSAWIYTWWKSGRVTEGYRVRAMVKFSPDHVKINIKTEAQWRSRGDSEMHWLVGMDTRLLQTLKTDIGGVVGRTAR